MKFVINPVTHSLALILGLTSYVSAEETTTELETMVVVGKQNSYLNPEVSTATKSNVDPKDTPLTVNVINQQFLQDIRAESLSDAYGYTTGLSQSGTNADSFSLRGIDTDLNNIQVNGLPGLASRFGSPTTANVERVEILKGPASIMYGQVQPGGLMNIITKKPQEEASFSFDISGNSYSTGVSEFGDDNSFTGSIDATGPLTDDKKWLYRFIVSAEDNNSYRDDVDSQNYYFFPTLTYRPDTETEVTFGLELQTEQRVPDDGLVVLDNDINQIAKIDTHYQSADDNGEDKGLVAFATFNTMVTDDFDITVDWRSVWHEDTREYYRTTSVDNTTDTVSLVDRENDNKRQYHFIDTRTTGSLWWGDVEHQLLAGLSFGYEQKDFDRLTYDDARTVDFSNPTDLTGHEGDSSVNHRITDYMNYAAYLQDTIYLNETWTLMTGIRYARQDADFERVDRGTTDSSSSDAFVSQAGVVYHLSEATSLYASYGESFNPNSIEDTDANGDHFDPEKGRQYEVGTKTDLFNNKANLSIAYFDIKKTNVVEENLTTGEDELLGGVKSTGVEVELLMMPIENWQVKLGYAYVDARVSDNPDDNIEGNRTAASALHDAYVWTKYNFPYKIADGIVGTTLGANYEGSRYTDEDSTDRVKLPGYTTVDIGLHYEIEHYRASLNIENLFNEIYYYGGSGDTNIYAGDPRNITFSLSGKF
ncbi:TonB-dependent receptor [Psychromonas sp. 14N.309.X.WAT.B.A12]|uniref:TonB-dependent siderophore receptor n=1 Tax=Psychromonas sp. 14N.309.X.WAT.B.A12 TaxID=2998322 RepID=UPI0025B0BCF6|nr:TonB-dependent receptor [Psychromonas sp. 14N.309.X.WAT.B.A12]MDN2662718.1 TonB-dependent receptor [Psychromonas sp. 14N.309.X.WAT.B.A12]